MAIAVELPSSQPKQRSINFVDHIKSFMGTAFSQIFPNLFPFLYPLIVTEVSPKVLVFRLLKIVMFENYVIDFFGSIRCSGNSTLFYQVQNPFFVTERSSSVHS